MLLDYLDRSQGELWLLEPVEIEWAAHVARQVEAAATAVESALRSAERHNLAPLPAFRSGDVARATLERWRTHCDQGLANVVRRIESESVVLKEAVRRAAERLPPCSDNGGQMRDAVIWLSFLKACEAAPDQGKTAFISANTRDFAETNKTSLKPALLRDAEEHGVDLVYYASLEDFISAQAEPYLQVTEEWLYAHLDLEEIATLLQEEVGSDPEGFQPVSIDHRDNYVPVGVPNVTDIKIEITGYFVWEFENGRTEVNVSCLAYLEADIDCERIAGAFTYNLFGDSQDTDHMRTRTLPCFAELTMRVIATVENGDITEFHFEDFEPV